MKDEDLYSCLTFSLLDPLPFPAHQHPSILSFSGWHVTEHRSPGHIDRAQVSAQHGLPAPMETEEMLPGPKPLL